MGLGDINIHSHINLNIDIHIVIHMNIENYMGYHLSFLDYSLLVVPIGEKRDRERERDKDPLLPIASCLLS